MNLDAMNEQRIGEALNVVECRLYQLDFERRKGTLTDDRVMERNELYKLLQDVYVRLVKNDEIDEIVLVCKEGQHDLHAATAILTYQNMLFISDQVIHQFPSYFSSYWPSRITVEQFVPISERIWHQLRETMQTEQYVKVKQGIEASKDVLKKYLQQVEVF